MSSASSHPPTVIRLGTPAEMVDALPYLVGFQPTNSLVAVSLRGSRGRVGLTARVDLPEPEWADECARLLVPHLRRDGARRVIVALYPPEDGPRHPAVRAVSDAMADRLGRAGIALIEVLCVHDGRWWSLLCGDPACCPAEGTPVADATRSPSPLGVAMAVEGRSVLPSRAALAETIEPVRGELAAAMRRALPVAQTRLIDRVWAGHRAAVASESLELLEAAVRRRVEGGPPCDVAEAARLIVGLDDVPVRDEVITWVDGAWGSATRALMAELVPRALPPFHVVPLTVLGWLAYQAGEGALASLAVERALADDPEYGLALLLDQALAAGLDPAVFRSALRGTAGRSAGRSRPSPGASSHVEGAADPGARPEPAAPDRRRRAGRSQRPRRATET